MGNWGSSSVSSHHSLSLLRIPITSDLAVSVYADSVITFRENPRKGIETVPGRQITSPVDPEGGVVALAVWPGAIDLAKQLVRSSIQFSGKRVLELGCGVGLPGICVAKFSSPAQVILTDRESARTVVEASIQGIDCCYFETFDWGSETDLKQFSNRVFDYVIGSEIVYAEEQAPLVNALLAVTSASPHTRVILSYTNRSDSDYEYMEKTILKIFQIESKLSESIFVLSRIS